MLPLPFVKDPSGSRPALLVPVQGATAEAVLADLATVTEATAGRADVPDGADAPDGDAAGVASSPGEVDAVEWRVDALAELQGSVDGLPASALDRISAGFSALREATDLPVIATVRTGFEGGLAPVSEHDYAVLVSHLVSMAPEALDVEIERVHARALLGLAARHGVPTIASFHDFEKTPPTEDLLARMRRMQETGANVAKIAVMPRDAEDVARVLGISAQASAELDIPVVVIAMGRLGRVTRVLGHDFGSAATFVVAGTPSAPGQLGAAQVREVLRVLGDA